MRDFTKLENWNKDRDFWRRSYCRGILSKNNIPFTEPSTGHFKITTKTMHTVMFYPKSGKIIYVENKGNKQRVFTNDDSGVIIRKLKSLTK